VESHQRKSGQGISGELSVGRQQRHHQRRVIAAFLMDTRKKYMGVFEKKKNFVEADRCLSHVQT
jgi:hypothetical protein